MLPYIDIYAAVPRRDPNLIQRFLDLCIPERAEDTGEYEFPQLSQSPEREFGSADELIRFMLDQPRDGYPIYWHSLAPGDPGRAMLFFVPRGGMVFGVSITSDWDSEYRQVDADAITAWLSLFAREFGARSGYALVESPPPYKSHRDFLVGLRWALPTKLIRGEVVRHPAVQPSGGAVLLAPK